MWRAAQRLQPLLCLRTAVAQSRFACSAGGGPSPDIGARVAASFVQSPTAAAHSIADALKPSDRLRLVAALTQQARQSADALEDSYVDRLFKLADKQPPSGSLARRAPRHPCCKSCRCTRAPAGAACSSRTRADKTAREVVSLESSRAWAEPAGRSPHSRQRYAGGSSRRRWSSTAWCPAARAAQSRRASRACGRWAPSRSPWGCPSSDLASSTTSSWCALAACACALPCTCAAMEPPECRACMGLRHCCTRCRHIFCRALALLS